MKKFLIFFCLLALGSANAQTKSSARLRNWIADFMPESDARTSKFVMVMADGTLRTWSAGGEVTTFPDFKDAVQVSAGLHHLLILKKDGTVWAIGKNNDYQLGNLEFTNKKGKASEIPLEVTGLSDVIEIDASGNSSSALLKDGTVWKWGNGNLGASGDGGKISSPYASGFVNAKKIPFKVINLENIIDIAGGMALRSDGTVWTWGSGNHGRLGNNITKATSTPVKVIGIENAVAISAMDGGLALMANGTVKSWGYNFKGQLGQGSKGPLSELDPEVKSVTAKDVVNVKDAIDIVGGSSCMALLRDGTVKGWGWGPLGGLGPLGKDFTGTPIKVHDLKNVIGIYSGSACGFALLKDGTLLGWGASMVKNPPYNHTLKVIKIAAFGNLAPKP